MQAIFYTDGADLYSTGAGTSAPYVTRHASPEKATRMLMRVMQAFLDISLGAQLPAIGLHIYANTLTGGYLVLAVTDQGATVYAATQADLNRAKLPVPPRSF